MKSRFLGLVGWGSFLLGCTLVVAQEDIKEVSTGSVTFTHLGSKPLQPAPTVFVLAGDRKSTLENSSFSASAEMLRKAGYFCVSLDSPAHGDDAKPGESGLVGWSKRVERGENLPRHFTRQASAVLDYLIQNGYTDPDQVVVIGISRGGFLGFHLMAADTRIAAVAALAPLTDLCALQEFSSIQAKEKAEPLALKHLAPRLVGRRVWILIGNRDQRVDTHRCLEFFSTLAQANASVGSTLPLNLHVVPGENHRQPPGSHRQIAEWIQQQFSRAE